MIQTRVVEFDSISIIPIEVLNLSTPGQMSLFIKITTRLVFDLAVIVICVSKKKSLTASAFKVDLSLVSSSSLNAQTVARMSRFEFNYSYSATQDQLEYLVLG